MSCVTVCDYSTIDYLMLYLTKIMMKINVRALMFKKLGNEPPYIFGLLWQKSLDGDRPGKTKIKGWSEC